MKKMLLICPYFGKLPHEYFQLILNSCGYNKSIDWLLITDDHTSFNFPQNVKVQYMSWEYFRSFIKERIKKDYSIEPSLDTPYKLCDYKPLYGVIFQEKLKDYDFWGNVDLTDSIYGDLRKFLTPEVLNNSEKINFLGHLTIYKNTNSINHRFEKSLKSGMSFTDVLESPKIYGFDEVSLVSISQIYKEYNYKVTRIDEINADISPLRYEFQLAKYDSNLKPYYEKKVNNIFYWKKGRLYRYYLLDRELKKKEYGYVHFQKRQMKNKLNVETNNSFFIIPNNFISSSMSLIEFITNHSTHRIYLPFFKLKFEAAISHLGFGKYWE